MLLSDLVDRLSTDVPAEDGVPSAEQYENAVRDAIRDFSERCGLEVVGTLNIVSGTATYDLPDDFLRLIKLYTLAGEGVLFGENSQIIPLSSSWQERYTIRNGKITFYPIPRHTVAREYSYKAGWIATDVDDYGDEDYSELGEREARIVLLMAKSLAMTKKVNAQEGSGLRYSFGAVSEDLSGSSDSSRKDAQSFESEYLEACKVYNGQHAMFG